MIKPEWVDRYVVFPMEAGELVKDSYFRLPPSTMEFFQSKHCTANTEWVWWDVSSGLTKY